MKKIKTCITNPELVKVGQCCEVRMNTRWMEMPKDVVTEPYIYLPAKIKKIEYHDCDYIPTVTVYLRKCVKRHNYFSLENLMIMSHQIAKIKEDGTIEDFETIIFK